MNLHTRLHSPPNTPAPSSRLGARVRRSISYFFRLF